MEKENPQEQIQLLLEPWHQSISNPVATQEKVLKTLLQGYARTEYGESHGASAIHDLSQYRQAFPATDYDGFKPYLDRVMAGETTALLPEEPIGWAITRGTTQDTSKFIPMTPTDMKMRVSAGRAMLNYVTTSQDYELFTGVNLNLNFPSHVGSLSVGSQELAYGYSSGIYAKYVSERTPIRSVPSQDEIDALGGGKTLRDWEARFELAIDKCRTENVTLVGGVAQTAIRFGKHLRKEHRAHPKDLWQTRIMTLGSEPGINTRLAPALRALYGPVVIREIYGATEGMFGQQRDHQRAWVPNYDLYVFEVQTRSGVKMLHEMKPNEMGNLIVSTPVFPRYVIRDRILALKEPYFRCIGRDRWWVPLRYVWDELASLNLGRL